MNATDGVMVRKLVFRQTSGLGVQTIHSDKDGCSHCGGRSRSRLVVAAAVAVVVTDGASKCQRQRQRNRQQQQQLSRYGVSLAGGRVRQGGGGPVWSAALKGNELPTRIQG